MDFSTACIHTQQKNPDGTGAISTPIYQTATFAHPRVGQSTGYDYSRVQNPTREQLERMLAQLEGGADALAFSSGMAAATALMELFCPGDHIIASDDLYGGSRRLFDHISKKNGIAADYVNTSDIAQIQHRLTPRTKAVFVETPSNPMMQVTDIAAVAETISGKDILLIVDNTFLTPFLCAL